MYKKREEVENWLKLMEIKNYVIHEDLTVDVNGDVNLSYKELEEIPIKFGIINGDFNCNDNYLTSLAGCPEVINGYFNCSYNELTSLEYCPKEVGGGFDCDNNELINFEYFPKGVHGVFISLIENKIKEKELVNFHCNIENLKEIYTDFNENGNKEEFLEKVNIYKSKRENELLKKLGDNSNNVKLNKKL